MFTKVKEYLLENKMIVGAALLFFFIRLPLLDHAFLLRGERDIVLTGYSLLKTGKDLYGNFMPLEFYGLDQPSPFLSFYYSAIGWIFFPFRTVFFARLPYVIASTFNLILVYELIKLITKNRTAALVTALVFSFSPGNFHLMSLALEVNIAMPLLLLGMLVYMMGKRIWGLIFITLSFFAYNGFRPLIPFLLVYMEYFFYLKKGDLKDFVKRSCIAGIFFVVLFGLSYTFIDGGIMKSRSGDLVFMNYSEIGKLVDVRRNTSGGPEILKTLINNKFTNTLYYMAQVTFEGVSLQYLFFRGDRAAIYTSTFAGQFFASLVVFYFMGFMYIGKIWKKEYVYVLGFIPVALVSSVVNVSYVSIAIRSLLASVSYAFVIALGFMMLKDILVKVKPSYRLITVGCVVLFLGFETMLFTYNYVLRRPTMMFESYFEHEKSVAEYLRDNGPDVTLYDDSPRNILTSYMMVDPSVQIQDVQAELTSKDENYIINGNRIFDCNADTLPTEMYSTGNVIAESCMSMEQHDAMFAAKVRGIPFIDWSFRNAYFIYDQEKFDMIDAFNLQPEILEK